MKKKYKPTKRHPWKSKQCVYFYEIGEQEGLDYETERKVRIKKRMLQKPRNQNLFP